MVEPETHEYTVVRPLPEGVIYASTPGQGKSAPAAHLAVLAALDTAELESASGGERA